VGDHKKNMGDNQKKYGRQPIKIWETTKKNMGDNNKKLGRQQQDIWQTTTKN